MSNNFLSLAVMVPDVQLCLIVLETSDFPLYWESTWEPGAVRVERYVARSLQTWRCKSLKYVVRSLWTWWCESLKICSQISVNLKEWDPKDLQLDPCKFCGVRVWRYVAKFLWTWWSKSLKICSQMFVKIGFWEPNDLYPDPYKSFSKQL